MPLTRCWVEGVEGAPQVWLPAAALICSEQVSALGSTGIEIPLSPQWTFDGQLIVTDSN